MVSTASRSRPPPPAPCLESERSSSRRGGVKEPGGDEDPGWMRGWGRRAALGVDLEEERSISRLLLQRLPSPPPQTHTPPSAAAPGRHVWLRPHRRHPPGRALAATPAAHRPSHLAPFPRRAEGANGDETAGGRAWERERGERRPRWAAGRVESGGAGHVAAAQGERERGRGLEEERRAWIGELGFHRGPWGFVSRG